MVYGSAASLGVLAANVGRRFGHRVHAIGLVQLGLAVTMTLDLSVVRMRSDRDPALDGPAVGESGALRPGCRSSSSGGRRAAIRRPGSLGQALDTRGRRGADRRRAALNSRHVRIVVRHDAD